MSLGGPHNGLGLRVRDAARGISFLRTSPSVSALVSVYAASDWMEGCLEDLTSQSLFGQKELEIIVVDANSPDGEEAVVREFQDRHPGQIRYFRAKQKISLYAAWNKAIHLSRGKYLTSANVDDKHSPEALEMMAEELDRSPDTGLVYADQWITENPEETFESHVPTLRWNWPSFDFSILQRRCIIGPQPLWRRSLHYQFGMFDPNFRSAGDWDFWLRIGSHVKMKKIDSVLGLYFRNPEGLELGNPAAAKEVEIIRKRHALDNISAEATIPVPVEIKRSNGKHPDQSSL